MLKGDRMTCRGFVFRCVGSFLSGVGFRLVKAPSWVPCPVANPIRDWTYLERDVPLMVGRLWLRFGGYVEIEEEW